MVDILEQTLFGHLSSSTLVDVIQAGVSDVDKANIEGNTPLHIACKTGPIGLHKRRCQIKVQFESGAKTKFLAALFQPKKSISHYQSVPWSHSFQNMYNTHMQNVSRHRKMRI